jgi:adenylate cyclase
MTVDERDSFADAGAGTCGLRDLGVCFEGAVPAVIATASGLGTPNVTYLSRVRMVDDSHIALSNQFFSKTARNMAENPRASVLLIDPTTYRQYRLRLVYERTERRGPVFDQLRADVDTTAALHGMQDVFKLRAADIYRVTEIDVVPSRAGADCGPLAGRVRASEAERTRALAQLSMRLSRCPDLDTLVGTAVAGLDELLGYPHTLLLLLDESGATLYTIATHGYEREGIGSEVVVGEGVIGMAAARCEPIRLGNLRPLTKYSRTIQRSYEEQGIAPGRAIPVPGLLLAQSRVAVPMMALGQLVGVLVVESEEPVAFDETDEALLTVVASLVADAIEIDRGRERDELSPASAAPPITEADAPEAVTHVRFFASDGSTFLDGEYLIKGVAGRILWSLLGHHQREGRTEFTNREVRLDPSLELPEFRDNFESRLILLKRRLGEREAPLRIEKTGRGRFRLDVDTTVRLDARP